MRLFMFPGQGSQNVGMGHTLFKESQAARQVFECVDDALGEKLSTLMFEGPEEDLTLTANAQPALMAVSIAALRALEKTTGKSISALAQFVAGHSLGEYSALTAAGALTLEDCTRLLRLRGQAMQKAVPVGKGTMAAILGLELSKVEEIVHQFNANNGLDIANDNAPGQIVISGETSAIEKAIIACKQAGAKRAIALTVSAPFHSSLMQPAADTMHEALTQVKISDPIVPVISNVTAKTYNKANEVSDLLHQQVCKRVNWNDSMKFFAAQGGQEAIEIGHGKVLCGLLRRIAPNITTNNISCLEEINQLNLLK